MAIDDAQGVGKMIAEYRRRHGMTMQQLADALGVYQPTVSRWEHGQRTPPARLMELALKGLDAERAEQAEH